MNIGRSRDNSGRAAFLAALTVALICALWTGCTSSEKAGQTEAGGQQEAGSGGDFVPGQLVVKLSPRSKIEDINREYGTRTLDKLLGSRGIYLLESSRDGSPEELAERISNDWRIVYAEPNFKTTSPEGDARHSAYPGGEPSPSSDPAPYHEQYAVGAMNLPEAHDLSRGEGTVVAVLDTGVQASHPALANSLTKSRYDFVGDDPAPEDVKDGVDNDGDGRVDDMAGHGTHVSGLVHLAAPEAGIMPLRVLDSEGGGNVFVLAEAMSYASNHGADVMNLSLGAPRQSEFVADIIEEVSEGDDDSPGSVVVAAAGNEDTSAPRYPAATGAERDEEEEEGALAVTASDQSGQKSAFANHGWWVDAAAPGSGVYSAFPDDRYARWDGTSMATPLVTGQAALMYASAGGGGGEEKAMCVSAAIKDTALASSGAALGGGNADAAAGVKRMHSNGCSEEEAESEGESEAEDD